VTVLRGTFIATATSRIDRLHGMPAECFLLGDGSSEILKLAASAFTSPERALVGRSLSISVPPA
jgi:hypothetical protein